MNSSLAASFKQQISTENLPVLGPEPRPGVLSVAELERKLRAFFDQNQVSDQSQQAYRAAALLWHDHLDESHSISQNLHDQNGSFLHGIMHRREPDYGNAKYWFHRVGQHAAFEEIGKRVSALLAQAAKDFGLARRLLPQGRWNPDAFIDACEECASERDDGPKRKLLQEIQAIEFDVLLTYL